MYLEYVELLEDGISAISTHYSNISKIYDDLDDFLQFYAHMNLISIHEADLNFEGKGGLPCKFLWPD